MRLRKNASLLDFIPLFFLNSGCIVVRNIQKRTLQKIKESLINWVGTSMPMYTYRCHSMKVLLKMSSHEWASSNKNMNFGH